MENTYLFKTCLDFEIVLEYLKVVNLINCVCLGFKIVMGLDNVIIDFSEEYRAILLPNSG